jgi:4-amino-4-deoxy-L-arabinose transferase-like glycosyltransferase
VSASDRTTPQARPGLRVDRKSRNAPRGLSAAAVSAASRVRILRWSAYAWGAIGAAAIFIAITCWWLTQDRSIPIYDAGDHLATAFEYHDMLAAGHLFGPFTQTSIYPILGGAVGALAAFVGGVNVASPIIGENLVFVPLLALGCYQTGRLLFGRPAGMLAVFFVLGSPLLISQFHVFMLDAPLTAVVSVSVWLVLASEDFSRAGIAGLAGLAVGLGFNMKSQFPLFLAGIVVVALLHGGWRNRRGFAIFCVVAGVVGAPWYIFHFSELGTLLELGGGAVQGAPPGNVPPTLSSDNLFWYFWNVLNSQLLAPLFVLAAGGTLWMVVKVVRGPDGRGAKLELLAGAFIAWLAITLTPHHDIRYGLPLLAYMAVIGTGWILQLPRAARLVAVLLLLVGVLGNTVGNNFGAGREVQLGLVRSPPNTEQLPDRIVLFTTSGFLVSAPRRDGDVPGLLEALHRNGVGVVTFSLEQSGLADFSFEGLLPLARTAGLKPLVTQSPEFSASASVATLVHRAVTAHASPPCTRLSDGTGVWVVRHDTVAGKLAFYCPTHHPQFYDVGAVG